MLLFHFKELPVDIGDVRSWINKWEDLVYASIIADIS